MTEFANNILSLPRYYKRAIIIILDMCLCIICVWFAFVLTLEKIVYFKELNFFSAIISVSLAIPIFWVFGLYKTILRYTNTSIILTIVFSTFFYAILYFLIIGTYGIEGTPRSVGVLQPMLLFFAITTSRLVMNSVLTINFPSKKKLDKQNVLVYGAGNAGRQLVTALENSPEFRVVGFLDDDKTIHKQVLFGKTIFLSSELGNLIERKKINLIFLALPSISRNKRNQIIHCLNQFNVRVKTLPSISEIVDGKITVSDIKDLNIDDLLCRDQVKADVKLLNKNVNSQTVLVTGAGGSIGSELCRQIIRLRPKKLILLELSEFALYQIYEELSSLNKNLKIVSLLANTQNQEKLEIIFESFGVNTVYHTAAYKHVPLVEENICEGVKNNVFSTIAVAKASINTKVSNFVFISSDKAVRPTNVMGATKRLSELCVQGIYNYHKNIKTNFSIVRFGNVLLSSGSVIPKFTKQIKDGGPITLTHPEITRYFMTVTEAAQLVIQAGAMGKFCEVFVLDMGKSIKIKNLICNMVSLYGYTIKDITNPSGDIEIKITGLRPGEKLYEELLIGEKPQKTSHKKIKKAEDPFVPYDSLKYELNDLYNLIKYNKTVEVKKMLCSLIDSFQSNTKIVDHIYRHQLKLKNDSKNNFTRIK